MSQRERRKTSTIQVSPELNLVLTKYATEQGCTKAEAADRVFSILYPKGVPAEGETSMAPPVEGTDEGGEDSSPGLGVVEEEEGVSKQLEGTVRDLRAVHTIRLLSGLDEKGGRGDDRITAKDAFELKRIEAMFGGGSKGAQGADALDALFQKYIVPIQTQVNQLQTQIQENRVSAAEKERDE